MNIDFEKLKNHFPENSIWLKLIKIHGPEPFFDLFKEAGATRIYVPSFYMFSRILDNAPMQKKKELNPPPKKIFKKV